MTTPGERPWEHEQPRGSEPPAYPPPPGYLPPPGYPPPPGAYPPPYQPVYGAPYAPGYGQPQTRTNGMAIGSLVASGLAIPLNFLCYSGALAAIVGIVLGIVALNQVKQSGEQGRGLAIAGIALGGVVLVFALILVIAIGVNL